MIPKPRSPSEMMATNQIVKCYAGSIAYGTNLPTSDVDFRGIFVADPISIRTPFYNVYEVEDATEQDTKFYELNKFMQLALDCNPNVIEILWTDPSDIVFSTPAYDLLRTHAPQLLSKKIAFTTTGYAMSQLSRIKGHNKWINNPMPVDPPTQREFMTLVTNFTADKVFKLSDVIDSISTGYSYVSYGRENGNNIYGVYKNKPTSRLYDDTGAIIEDETIDKGLHKPLFLVKHNRAEYATAREKWAQYWDWKRNRNAKRSELEELHGFDTKHAMHLVRLLRMGKEALSTGVIQVKREDAAELLAIRNGSMTYDEILSYANSINEEIKVLSNTTALPSQPNRLLAADLIMKVQDLTW